MSECESEEYRESLELELDEDESPPSPSPPPADGGAAPEFMLLKTSEILVLNEVADVSGKWFDVDRPVEPEVRPVSEARGGVEPRSAIIVRGGGE